MADPAQRIVPGAPPPPPLSKSQKKKRKAASIAKKPEDSAAESPIAVSDAHAAAFIEKAPEAADINEGAIAPQLIAKQESVHGTDEDGKKNSPMVELIYKRIRTLNKKIARIHTYSSKPTSELNDDQKKTLATLPSLEATVKELEETKKAVGILEAEQAKDLARHRAIVEEQAKQKAAETLAAAQAAHTARTAQIFDLLHLHGLLSTGGASAQHFSVTQEEIDALDMTVTALVGRDSEARLGVLGGLFAGEGDIGEGIPYIRLLELAEIDISTPEPEETIIEPEAVLEPETVIDEIMPAEGTANVLLAASTAVGGGGTSFHFMQESEIDLDPTSFENGAEFVEKEDALEPIPAGEPVVVIEETVVAVEPAPISAALDWADDEGGLPQLDHLQASFGTPPAPDIVPESAQPEEDRQAEEAAAAELAVNGNGAHTNVDDDGFMQARGGRGRGRARGGFRGGDRGGFRGGDRGGFRGGDRGGYRGAYRGGDRGERGGFRGKPFNGPNGEQGGQWRGNSNGDGEYRGRGGRGRGRGAPGNADRGSFYRGRGGQGGQAAPAPAVAAEA